MKRLLPVVALGIPLVALLLVALFMQAPPRPVAVDQDVTGAAAGVVLIFDDSGSMEMQAGGQSRMALAKQVTEKDFVAKLDLGLAMGLVFLNQSGGNLPLARGSAWVVPPQGESTGSCQKNELMERIATIEPTGTTPLTEAVQTARGFFAGKALPRRLIVIITDGAANHQDSFMAELDASLGEKFELYAIGFCLDEAGSALRAKLNADGQTRFFDATGTADSLALAFRNILSAGKLEASKD